MALSRMTIVRFFQVPVADLEPAAFSHLFSHWLYVGRHWIATANAEILLRASRDLVYRRLLQQADLLLPETGPVWMSRIMLRSRGLQNRFPGVEVAEQILTEANRKGVPVLLLVAQHSLSSPAEVGFAIRQLWPGIDLRVESAQPAAGPGKLRFDWQAHRPAVVFANFGVPEQDRWMKWARDTIPSVRISMGVGGAFDYWTGRLPRAPRWLRTLGLEWMWRLGLQPQRFGRIWNAVIRFPLAVWRQPPSVAEVQID